MDDHIIIIISLLPIDQTQPLLGECCPGPAALIRGDRGGWRGVHLYRCVNCRPVRRVVSGRILFIDLGGGEPGSPGRFPSDLI